MAVASPLVTSVLLARGLGRRMREPDGGGVRLAAAQLGAARTGQKAMMPIGAGGGRPFLDYVLSALADAGCGDVVLVVGPEHDAFRERYAAGRLSRVTVRFAVQPEPTGTAHAVLAAEEAVGNRPFLVLNADNLYPVDVLRMLAQVDGPALPAFERWRLVEESGFPEERVSQFAVLQADGEGRLTGIREKPDSGHLTASGSRALISMNLWRFDARIFEACRDVPRSTRGEYELPEAVGLAVARGVRFQVLPARGAVLDLTRRADIARVGAQLAGQEPRL
jgi:glucose-1-phosphate thymidylyltransferase